jgi:DNA gyrase subunit B
LEDTTLVTADGERGGQDLREVVKDARIVMNLIDQLHSRYNRGIVEQAAIIGLLNPELLSTQAKGEAAAQLLAARLDQLAEETETGWEGTIGNEGYVVRRLVRGVMEAHTLDRGLISSLDARRINERHAGLAEVYAQPAKLKRKSETIPVHGPRSLLEAIYDAGRKGLTLQRYKGLGEMNPEQLWETTLDRDARTLLQVKIGDLAETDEIFSKLMGDVVEPRREFIQDNALSVQNLDV